MWKRQSFFERRPWGTGVNGLTVRFNIPYFFSAAAATSYIRVVATAIVDELVMYRDDCCMKLHKTLNFICCLPPSHQGMLKISKLLLDDSTMFSGRHCVSLIAFNCPPLAKGVLQVCGPCLLNWRIMCNLFNCKKLWNLSICNSVYNAHYALLRHKILLYVL